MASRIRTVKPELFRHEGLFEAEQESGLPLRLAFIGLFTVCDREGRFPWKPRALKLDVLPFDTSDFSAVLDALQKHRFLFKYEHDGKEYGFIPSWLKHQVINTREAKSVIASPPEDYMAMHVHAHAHTADTSEMQFGVNVHPATRETVFARDGYRCVRCSSTEDLTIDHIFPQCMGGTHALTNLRTLCRPCNSGRPIGGDALISDLAKDGLTLNDMQRMCMHVQAQGEGKGREGEQEGKGKGKARVADAWLASLVDLGVNEQHAKDWLAVRKGKGAKMSDSVMQATQREAKKANVTLAYAIQICAERGWQGFRAEYLANKPVGFGGGYSKADDVAAHNQAVVEEIARRQAQRTGSMGNLADPSTDEDGFLTIEGDFFHAT